MGERDEPQEEHGDRSVPRSPADALIVGVSVLSIVGAGAVLFAGDPVAMAPFIGMLMGIGAAGITFELFGGRHTGMRDADFSWGGADSMTKFKITGPAAMLFATGGGATWFLQNPGTPPGEAAECPAPTAIDTTVSALSAAPAPPQQNWFPVDAATGAPVDVPGPDGEIVYRAGRWPSLDLQAGALEGERVPVRLDASTQIGSLALSTLRASVGDALGTEYDHAYRAVRVDAPRRLRETCDAELGEPPFALTITSVGEPTTVTLSRCDDTGDPAPLKLFKGTPKPIPAALMPAGTPAHALLVTESHAGGCQGPRAQRELASAIRRGDANAAWPDDCWSKLLVLGSG